MKKHMNYFVFGLILLGIIATIFLLFKYNPSLQSVIQTKDGWLRYEDISHCSNDDDCYNFFMSMDGANQEELSKYKYRCNEDACEIYTDISGKSGDIK